MKTWVLIRNPTIREDFFLEFLIDELQEEIKHTVRMLNPFTLSQAATINNLLEGYPNVFAEPKTLPPRREQDHYIPRLDLPANS